MIKYFGKNIFQRLFYASLIALLIVLNFYNNKYQLSSDHHSFGIIYLWVFMFPATILLIQILFNSYVGWISSMLIYAAFLVYIFYSVFTDILKYGSPVSSAYSLNDYLLLSFTMIIVIALGYILVKIRKVKTLF